MAPHLYSRGLDFAYVGTLLYELLRIAPKVELFYRLRGRGDGPRRHVSQRMGYSGRTGAYKNLRRVLTREGILNKDGIFIENGPNIWLARLGEHVEDAQVAVCIGRRVPYMIFLALVLEEDSSRDSAYRLARELKIPVTSLYSGVRRLVRKGLMEQGRLSVADQEPVKQLRNWLRRYLDLTIQHANLIHDSSKMFQAVPAYIDGLEAVQRVQYTAGMPIGPAPMVIRTYLPYRSFWVRTLGEVDDFRNRSTVVSVGPALARTDSEIVWISGLPYASRPDVDQ